jgi:hypothetical protein
MNPMTRQWVFLEYNTSYGRWFPHASTMRSWALNQIRVYHPLDNPATLVTMPDNLSWPAMSPSEYPYIATADVPESWVSNNQINTALNEDEIDSYDCMVSEPPPQLTPLTMLAGILLSMGPPQQNGPPPLILSILESESHPFITSLLQGTSLQPIQISQPIQQNQPIQPIQQNQPIQPIQPIQSILPPHVAAVMIQHAVNTGASCPITMEPLTAKNATVTPCGHVFDRDALSHWTTDHGSCPECRTPVTL